MKPSTSKFLAFLLVAAVTFPAPATAFFNNDVSNSEELVALYPALESNRTGNPLILCPFLRLLERSGRLDEYETDEEEFIIQNRHLKEAVDDFGCDRTTACGPVIDLVSAGQRVTDGFSWSDLNPFERAVVDLERLWDAPPVSHDCGFTFEPGDLAQNGVSAARLENTLGKLAAKASNNMTTNATTDGTLVYQDLLDTKTEICEEEGVEISSAGLIETQLIFAFLGGVERGFIEYSDVERFLQVDNQMPLKKAGEPITAFYLQRVN